MAWSFDLYCTIGGNYISTLGCKSNNSKHSYVHAYIFGLNINVYRETLARFLIWRIGEICGKSPNLKTANIISYTIALCGSARDRQI